MCVHVCVARMCVHVCVARMCVHVCEYLRIALCVICCPYDVPLVASCSVAVCVSTIPTETRPKHGCYRPTYDIRFLSKLAP